MNRKYSIDSADFVFCVTLWGGYTTGFWIPAGLMMGVYLFQAFGSKEEV